MSQPANDRGGDDEPEWYPDPTDEPASRSGVERAEADKRDAPDADRVSYPQETTKVVVGRATETMVYLEPDDGDMEDGVYAPLQDTISIDGWC